MVVVDSTFDDSVFPRLHISQLVCLRRIVSLRFLEEGGHFLQRDVQLYMVLDGFVVVLPQLTFFILGEYVMYYCEYICFSCISVEVVSP